MVATRVHGQAARLPEVQERELGQAEEIREESVMAKKAKDGRLRPTILDVLETGVVRNIWCKLDDLTNEAAVEQFFVSRLLAEGLGYADAQIKPKTSLDKLIVARGNKKIKYKPDYVLMVGDQPRCVIDAKAPDESLDDWIEQCSGYCLALNRRFETNPVRFFILSNGKATRLYAWDQDQPILSLDFTDFVWGNPKYEQFRGIVAPDKIIEALASSIPAPNERSFSFTRPTPERARQLFAVCHKAIWKSEVGSPAFAFMEFIKVMFVKLMADKQLRKNPATSRLFTGSETVTVPASSVIFSVEWLESREKEGTVNPFDTILFSRLRDDIEKSIELRQKKRLFDTGEQIKLRPDTVKEVVRRLEHFDMFGIDEDLNGRLFETFLSATMRGRELGQFFTPRSIVKMMARLADLKVDRRFQDKVIDGCCGSGGFLIEALTLMRNSIRGNESYSPTEKESLLETVCNECLYGIDYAKEPLLARIARINMYLHGDGGSRIYFADALDKTLDSGREKDPEIVQNVIELREHLARPVLFDVVLTNPPFSMTKSAGNDTERQILEQYTMGRKSPTAAKLRSSIRSSVLFFERYADILRPGGKLLTVIDESILAGPEYAFARDYIRQHFLIRAIISLPGDAFRRSGSRIKTSVLFLEKKQTAADAQPPCFTFFSICLGIDDLTPRAGEADIIQARALAVDETNEIIAGYEAYLAGKKSAAIVPAARLADTLDLKSVVPLFGRMAPEWERQGIEVKKLSECMTPVGTEINPSTTPDKEFTLVKVGYDGRCKVETVRPGKAIKYSTMYQVKAGQIVFSTIRAVNGAVAILPAELDGALVSQSYSVFDCASKEDTVYVWAMLRSHEIRADLQSAATGASRYYAYWSAVKSVMIPWLPEKKRKEMAQQFLDIWEMERKIWQERDKAASLVAVLGVESNDSIRRWEASKPPQ
jgi:type I restriction enzyme M protein